MAGSVTSEAPVAVVPLGAAPASVDACERGPRDAVAEPESPEESWEEFAEPVEPPDPRSSAAAKGTATLAAPTPSAIANAPTRPMYHDTGEVAVSG